MPLPDFSAEITQIENEKNTIPVETENKIPEVVEEPTLTEEEIFKKQKREKLLAHLAKCREKSAVKRKEQKEEKAKTKKPRGRPRKVDNGGEAPLKPPCALRSGLDEQPVEQESPMVKQEPPKISQAPPLVVHANPTSVIDYDRIINGVHQKYLSAKAERKKTKVVPTPAPAPVAQQPVFNKHAFEAQVREDERQRIKAEVERKKNDQLRQRTKDYYARLPPRSLASNKSWDSYFFDS